MYFSCKVVILGELDENIYLVLTFDAIIFFDEEFNVIERISISDVNTILQDHFKQNLCLISTTKKKFLLKFDESFFKLMFFDYFSSVYYTMNGLTPDISVRGNF